ncbi:hypothetical protein GCM10007304_16490 [Rhodococcoides trifolii]|uniref:Preprotein translocase n=1 Tax=Rhodococcoides trifolii TaxID=908250 RepID=A0A917FS36_9NOCA|nr:twin-arginine translocase TatA/TatE family subunit [Rhodococcus trifolii]GGG03143.1 hypothetical protein GCM10007304_16490 [Rhodococcus trifolii]
MFGLTIEKLFIVAIIGGLVLGPSRLPDYAHQLTRAIRALKNFVETTHTAAEHEMGMPLRRSQWQSLDLQQYDPRRIVRDALQDTTAKTDVTDVTEQAARVRPGQKYIITGTTSHPVRTLIASLPADDPRRIAADVGQSTSSIGDDAPHTVELQSVELQSVGLQSKVQPSEKVA